MDKQQIIARIKELHAAGEPLNIHAVKRHHPELIGAAIRIRPYWGWKRALEEAGISYDQIRFAYHPTVKCLICGFEGTSLSSHLRFKHKLSPEEYREKFPDAEVESEERLYKFYGRRKIIRHPPIPPWESVISEEYVYDRVAEYRRQGIPITTDFVQRNDRPIYAYALRRGKKWPEMCAFMGPEYEKEAETPKPPPDPLRTYEDTLQALRDLDLNGYLPTERTLRTKHWSVWRDMRRHFADYAAAAKAVKLKIAKGHRLPEGIKSRKERAAKYPPKKVLEIAREMSAKGSAPRKVDLKDRDPDLWVAVEQHFGNMGKLYEAMGMDHARVRVLGVRYPDKDSIIEEIRRRDEAGLPLGGRPLIEGPHRDTALQITARKYFGSWKEALKEAGVSAPEEVAWKRERVPVYATREAVVEELKRRHAAGEPVRAYQLQQGSEADRELLLDSYLHFGPHVEALKAAGLRRDGRSIVPPPRKTFKPRKPRPPRPPTGPTREEVLEFIRDRAEKGLHLNCDKISRSGGRRMANAARRIFGHWRAALKAVGLEVPDSKTGSRRNPPPTREEIIAFMHKRVEDGLTLSSFQLAKKNPGNRYYRTAKQVFGSWENALRAAGFDPQEIIARFSTRPKAEPKPPKVRKPRPKPREIFSEEFILETMRTRLAENKSVRSKDVTKEEGFHFAKSVRARFGKWSNLLEKLGVESPTGKRPVDRPSKEEIIAYLQARVAEEKSVSSPQLTLTSEGARIYNAGVKEFGSWHGALRAAGFDPKEIIARFKRRPRRMPKFLERYARSKEKTDVAPDPAPVEEEASPAESGPSPRSSKPADFPTREATAAEFARILAASGVDTSEFADDFESEPEDPEKRRIINALRERAAAGKAMKYGVICLGPPALRDRALYDAALNAFGSWKAALEEAGVR